jgi:hypothetical protein
MDPHYLRPYRPMSFQSHTTFKICTSSHVWSHLMASHLISCYILPSQSFHPYKLQGPITSPKVIALWTLKLWDHIDPCLSNLIQLSRSYHLPQIDCSMNPQSLRPQSLRPYRSMYTNLIQLSKSLHHHISHIISCYILPSHYYHPDKFQRRITSPKLIALWTHKVWDHIDQCHPIS